MRKSGLETAWSTEAHYDSCTAFQGDSRIGGMVAITSMRSAVRPGGARPFEDVRDSFPTQPHSHGISARQDFGYGKRQAFEISLFGLAGVSTHLARQCCPRAHTPIVYAFLRNLSEL